MDKNTNENKQEAGQADMKLTPSVKAFFRGMAMKSVAIQAKKYGRKKFVAMGKKAGLSHTRRAEERRLKALQESGDLVDAKLK